jgi:hypothetical protein
MARRVTDNRSLQDSIYVVAEGNITEREYLKNIQKFIPAGRSIRMAPKSSSTSPDGLVKQAQKATSEMAYSEIWILHDLDAWRPHQIKQITDWAQQSTKTKSAITSPCFEYWLLLHFEDGRGIQTAAECIGKLRQHWPSYAKSIPVNKFSLEAIQTACERSAQRPPFTSASKHATSEVHLLVGRLLAPKT